MKALAGSEQPEISDQGNSTTPPNKQSVQREKIGTIAMSQQDYGRAEIRTAPQYSSPKSFSRCGCPSAIVIAELRCAIAKRNVDRPIGC
jgi:hypothetical protein